MISISRAASVRCCRNSLATIASNDAYKSPCEGFDRSGPMWAEQRNVERLPLPPLAATLERYVQHLEPLVVSTELHNVRTLADEFGAGEGALLHAELQRLDAESVAREGSYGQLAQNHHSPPLTPRATRQCRVSGTACIASCAVGSRST